MDMIDQKKIFSGEESRELWGEINSLGKGSTAEDIADVLYSLTVALQNLEAKIDGQKRKF